MQSTDTRRQAQPVSVTVNGRTYDLDVTTELDGLLASIARRQLGMQVLREFGSDKLDFFDCHVAGIRAALAEAYEAGRAAGSA